MTPLREVAALFLKLGFTAFGGPPAHIAMMRREVVEKRRWLSEQAFLDLLGATNLIPGPNSTEMAIHLGYLRAGFPGLVAAGTCFIAPPMLMVLAAAWGYVRFGSLPQLGWLLYGVKPVVVALVVHALWNLGRKGLARPADALIGAAAFGAYLAGLNEIAILAAGGFCRWIPAAFGVLRFPFRSAGGLSVSALPDSGKPPSAAGTTTTTIETETETGKPLPPDPPEAANHGRPREKGRADALALPGLALPGTLGAGAALAAGVPASLPGWLIFLKFLNIGAVLYGSGYVLLPFLNAAFAGQAGPLSPTQILDAVAVGQVTPGPFFTTATFVGYLLGGVSGGLLATAGIFLPAFVFVALTNPWIPRLRSSRALGRILDGVNAASLGLMGGAAWWLGRAALFDFATFAVGAAALLLLALRFSATGLLAAGGLIGIVARALAS